MAALFGIADKAKKYPHQLSGGQKQMVAIASSLVHRPEIFLMDEPLANIDVRVKEGILVMNKGVIEASGTKKEIGNSTNHFVRSFI